MADHPTSRRGPSGQYMRTTDTAERDAEACRLRGERRMSYQQIADAMGYGDKGSAYRAIQRGLAAIPQEAAAEVLRLELEKLDTLERAALEVLERQHVTVSHGKIVYRATAGGQAEPLFDDAPVLQAIDRMLKIQERRAKLLGLDAPKRLEVITIDWLDEQIRTLTAELERQLADLGGADPGPPGAAEGAARA